MAKYAVFASFSLLLRSVLLFLRRMAYSLLTLVVLDFSTRNLVCSYLVFRSTICPRSLSDINVLEEYTALRGFPQGNARTQIFKPARFQTALLLVMGIHRDSTSHILGALPDIVSP